MFPLNGKFRIVVNCVYNVYIFELSSCTDKIAPLILTFVILKLVLGCHEGQILSFHLHSTSMSRFLCCCGNAESCCGDCVFLSVWRDEQRAWQFLKKHILVL